MAGLAHAADAAAERRDDATAAAHADGGAATDGGGATVVPTADDAAQQRLRHLFRHTLRQGRINPLLYLLPLAPPAAKP